MLKILNVPHISEALMVWERVIPSVNGTSNQMFVHVAKERRHGMAKNIIQRRHKWHIVIVRKRT